MEIRFFAFVLLLFSCAIPLSAQNRTMMEVGIDTTKFSIETQPHPQHPGLYIYKEIYLSTGNTKITGNSLSDKSARFTGPVSSFFMNGLLASEITYRDGKKLGRANYYYKNGVLMKQIDHITRDDELATHYDDYKMIHFYDSAGKQLVKDGNGTCREYNDRDGSWQEGEYKDGFRQGIWNSMDSKGLFYQEEYKQGKLLKRNGLLEGIDITKVKSGRWSF